MPRTPEGHSYRPHRAFPPAPPGPRRCPSSSAWPPGRHRQQGAAVGCGMIDAIRLRHVALSALFCCPNRPSAQAVRGGYLDVKRRHCDLRPRPAGELLGAGTFQIGREVWRCFPAQARVFARPRRFGVAVGRSLPRGAPQIWHFGWACGSGCHTHTGPGALETHLQGPQLPGFSMSPGFTRPKQ